MNDRDIKELLLLLKEELVKDRCAGLCGLLRGLQFTEVITVLEKEMVKSYIEEYKPNIETFYTMAIDGSVYKTDDSYGTYLWEPYDDQARLDWLDARIKEETRKN